jgi:hypothetical protein
MEAYSIIVIGAFSSPIIKSFSVISKPEISFARIDFDAKLAKKIQQIV